MTPREVRTSTTSFYRDIDSPLGPLRLFTDGAALTGVYFLDGRDAARAAAGARHDTHPILADASRQLEEYSNGRRKQFDLPVRPAGTAFQRAIWDAISAIPFGETITYRELGERVGSPLASRAAGLATGRNPLAIVVPCHRVIGSNGTLTGYGGGLPRKEALLAFERAVARGDRAPLASFIANRQPLLSFPPETARPR